MALLCGGIGFLVMWVGGIYAGIDLQIFEFEFHLESFVCLEVWLSGLRHWFAGM